MSEFLGVMPLAMPLLGIKRIQRRKIANIGLKYVLGLAFSNMAVSCLFHWEFIRMKNFTDLLGANDLNSLNGNWIFNRWDGTVYGLTDEELTILKRDNVNGLLYSYVSGVQSENYLTQVNVIQDFYHHRTFYKNPLYLYNAYFVWDYFHFSASSKSDSAKASHCP
jgi:hypothetical protein